MIHYYICRETEGGEAILAIADNPSFFAESSNKFEAGWHSSIPDIRVESEPGGDTTGTVFVEEITEAEFKNIESFKLVRIASIGEYQLRRIHTGGGTGGNVQISGGSGGSSGVGGNVTLNAGNGVAGAGAGGSVMIAGGCAGGAGGGPSSQGGI